MNVDVETPKFGAIAKYIRAPSKVLLFSNQLLF
jgi:hypothetical protein